MDKEKKWSGGGIPYGYRFDEKSSLLIVDEYEAKVLQNIFRLATIGLGVNKIANELNKMRVQPRRGREWTSTIITYILSPTRLRYYLGIDKNNNEGNWPPLLDIKTFIELTSEAEKPIFLKKPKEFSKDKYLLTGLGIFKCGYCGGNVKASITTRDQKRILYYLCSRRQNAGLSSCSKSRLHRQDRINNLVLGDLSVKTSQDIFELIVRRSEELKNIYQKEVINIFNVVAKEFNNYEQIDPNIAVDIIEQGYKAILNVQKITNKLLYPIQMNKDDLQKSIADNIEEIFLYDDTLEIIYNYPIKDNLERKEVIKITDLTSVLHSK